MVTMNQITSIKMIELDYADKNLRVNPKPTYLKPTYKYGGGKYRTAQKAIDVKTILNDPKYISIEKELKLDDAYNYYANSEYQAIIDSQKYSTIKNPGLFKTYMVLKNTKFNRDILAQKVGDAKKVISPKKADIIIGDLKSFKDYFSITKFKSKELDDFSHESINWVSKFENGCLKVYKSTQFKITINDLNVNVFKQLKINNDDYKSKLIHIEDFLNNIKDNRNLILEDSEFNDLINQVCLNKDLVYVALNTISVYPEKYRIYKYFLFLLAHILYKVDVFKLSPHAAYYYRIFIIDKHITTINTHSSFYLSYFISCISSYSRSIDNNNIFIPTKNIIKFLNNSNLLQKLVYDRHNYNNDLLSISIKVDAK